MDIKDQIINGPGYAIAPIDDLKCFEKLRKVITQKLQSNKSKMDIEKLRIKMMTMSKSEINNVMVGLLSFNQASEIMLKSCRNIVKKLSGEEVFLQRRANIIFNLPGKEQRRQWPHYELMSGVSPFTYIIWAPFHDLDDDGGVFYIDQTKSFKTIKKEHKQGLVNGPLILKNNYNEKPAKLKYGEVIIFNPFILHGNINFISNKARIACSVRFQSIKKPLMQRNTDYYKYLKIN
jgi:sporadic carbohydrate cluster 2OG-Fe(II) oxygenase